jgi:gluconolactonase
MNKLLIVSFLCLINYCSYAQVAIAKGEVRGPFVWKSEIYPGTERNYWVYVPKQYDASKPACLMVVQDGLSRATGWNLPSKLDSLIAIKQIPVMIGLFIDHGIVPSTGQDNYPRYNRSYEYDALGDRYANFLLNEILPEVSKTYNISSNPDDRSIAGASSGAICAFNTAWERPDSFRRVFSSIGTYIGLRGADDFATLVRKSEPKPLRVFLQDGNHDLNIYAGDWWMANQNMLSALTWAGYEVNHAWGEGGHDGKHATSILAGALTWLWKDYPAPVVAHKTATPRLDLTVDGEAWNEIQLNTVHAVKLATNKTGEIFFADKLTVYKLDISGKLSTFAKLKEEITGLSFHSDGKLYASDPGQHKIIAIDDKGAISPVASNIHADFITISNKGIYFSDLMKEQVGFYSFLKKDVRYVSVKGRPSGLALSAEQTFLNVGITNSAFGFSFNIMEEGALQFGQEYTHYQQAYGTENPNVLGMTLDAQNVLYSSTNLGIQVADQLGRINFIFTKPAENATDVKLGGSDFNILYASCDGKLFKRKINAKGVLSWLPAVKPPKPGL